MYGVVLLLSQSNVILNFRILFPAVILKFLCAIFLHLEYTVSKSNCQLCLRMTGGLAAALILWYLFVWKLVATLLSNSGWVVEAVPRLFGA